MKGRYKNRALHLAAQKGDVKMVKLLLGHGASLKTKNYVNETPEEDSRSAEVAMILRNHASGKGKEKVMSDNSNTLPPPPEPWNIL